MSRLLKLTDPVKLSFRECIRNGNATCVISKYDKKAILKGTFAKKPVQGKEKIEKYFDKLLRTVKDVKFEKDPIIFKRNDLIVECGNYTFIRCNGEKVKANYQFVIIPLTMKILSHFSSILPK